MYKRVTHSTHNVDFVCLIACVHQFNRYFIRVSIVPKRLVFPFIECFFSRPLKWQKHTTRWFVNWTSFLFFSSSIQFEEKRKKKKKMKILVKEWTPQHVVIYLMNKNFLFKFEMCVYFFKLIKNTLFLNIRYLYVNSKIAKHSWQLRRSQHVKFMLTSMRSMKICRCHVTIR